MATLKSTVIGGSLNVSGNITASSINTSGQVVAQSFKATSDKNLKENIQEFVLDKSILSLPIYRYDFIEGEKNQIGCLAQDLQKLYPELVNEENGHLVIQENKLVYLLIAEMQKEIKELKEEIKLLKEK